MATLYIQLQDKLLQISGELTAENISKALGYVPVDSSTMNNYATKDEVSDLVDMSMVEELSQRVDNITFDSLKDNPFLQDGSGELNIVDESGNIIAKIDAEGIHSVDFIAGEHRLSDKTDKTYVDEAIKNVEVDLTGYATEEYVNNIDFYNIKDNPIVNNGDGKLLFVDENGYIGLQLEEDGLYVKDVIAGNHKLTDKIDSSALNGYATEEWVENKNYLTEHQDISHLATKEEVSNIDFYNIKDNPIVNNGDGKLLFVDENGYIGLQLEEDGLYVKDVIADGHTLSQKADKSELSNYATKDEVSDLVDMSVVTELQGKVETLVGEDADKSVRDIAVDVLTETLVSETATEAYDTLAEMSAWIKSHPEDASAMNTAIQKNTTDITNLDASYKAADAKVLTDAQEYTDNINFFTIKDNPIADNNDGNLTFVDESGNVGFQINEEGLRVTDVIAGEHKLSEKANASDIPSLDGYVKTEDIPSLDGLVKSEDLPNFDEFAKTEDIPSLDGYAKTEDIPSLDGYASKEWVNNRNYATEYDLKTIDYSSINNVPVSEDETGELNIADESGNIGMKVASEAVYAKDFVAGEHKLSEKQDELVSGTNIKTINGISILGDGDITISGGSDANVQAVDTGDVIDDVNVDYATTAYVDNKVANINLTDYATIIYVDGLVGDINSVLESIING